MHRHFEHDLEEIQQKLLQMGGIAEDMIRRAVASVLNRDGQMAQAVLETDDAADALENEIEERCIGAIARYQPAASDLRFLATVMRINSDLERIADKAASIAQRSLELLPYPPVKPFIDLPRVADIVQRMVKESLDAFVNRDAALAQAVRGREDEVDSIYDETARELLALMTKQPEHISPGISVLLIFRHLERIADHAANISEEVYYLVEGNVIRHSDP
jgi:phosphate transport system protein